MRLFFCVFLFISAGVFAQNIDSTKVPKAVRHELDSIYPLIKNSSWQLNTDSLYVTSFVSNGQSKKLFFSKDGDLTRVITDIPIGKTPQFVKDALDQKYKDYQLLSLSSDVKYASMTYMDEKTKQMQGMNGYTIIDYSIRLTADGKIYNLDYNYNTRELMEE